MGDSYLEKDAYSNKVPLMRLSAPQTVAVNSSVGAAVLSAAFNRPFVRLQPTADVFVLFTVAGAVTSATGHFLAAGGCYDLPVGTGNTKVSALGVSGAGTLYLSELG
jgi:hypothetical protein